MSNVLVWLINSLLYNLPLLTGVSVDEGETGRIGGGCGVVGGGMGLNYSSESVAEHSHGRNIQKPQIS